MRSQFGVVFVVGVFLDGEFLFVGVIAGIDADDFDPFDGFHGGVGLEMDVGDDGDVAVLRAQFADDVLEIRGVFDGGRGDADELAADGDEFERLLDAFGGVHGVAGQHGLFHDGMIAADDHSAVGRIADDNFARPPPLIKKWRFAITHCLQVTMKWPKNTKDFLRLFEGEKGLLCAGGENNGLFPVGVRAAHPVASVKKRNVEHETNQ